MTPSIDRRTLLAAGAALAATPACAQSTTTAAAADPKAVTRAIPSTGEQIPVVGIGTSRVFDFAAEDAEAYAQRKEVLQILANGPGGNIIDTAPSYGRAEERLGDLFADTGLRERFFIAGKVAARRDTAGQREELEQSRRRMRTQNFELIQYHNVSNANQDFALLREWKDAGVIKYHGMTTTSEGAYEPFEQALAREKPDFIEIDYAIDNRSVEDRILPLAADNNVAVLTALPFGRNRLFQRTANVPLPDYAAELGIDTWAKFFLKWLISHPTVTAVIPGTDLPQYMRDNLGAGTPPFPDQTMRQRMASFIESLPS
jgi:aryl-alcohol dehydrogenase-like predicted oxidoreductase